ncbi:MAG: DNA cytosine methyltransferase [Mesorhizobium sp.]|uniref:DNA cytosine methyltransferase n=1 Tax=Mesorhizobium sp. TaxID=1871066 RepID=UPI000FE9473A|nr:MAG: DNA cytosine methyltransferase [Mesorhizobium sp.]RWH72428.1 MAG: DNA cytosine methyltransferase [Mesorhizobium sp.]RWH81361.1 MAG: DNA cytosine methyltransferase [Mesorhizobium sp.]RWH89591.1 MAG: DNA cytosine methyltransferase [Mesorhizobium sp.]RWH92533.1 MAG: DNA cytosine methyltransferase [Mesorhizobium sp.]
MKAAALFSGIGGFCLGFERQGIKTQWALELNQHAVETYRANVSTPRIIQKDIREVSVAGDDLEPVDVLHAGFPCTNGW